MSADLYETDFYAWAKDQAHALRRLADARVSTPAPIDWEHLIEEVDELAKARLRELRSRYTVLVAHLLEWQFQADQRSSSWRGTIVEQRNEIEDLLEENPSLRRLRQETLEKAWPRARRLALAEAGFPDAQIEAVALYTVDQLEAFDFWPGPADA
jgi:hypothetical protein